MVWFMIHPDPSAPSPLRQFPTSMGVLSFLLCAKDQHLGATGGAPAPIEPSVAIVIGMMPRARPLDKANG
jgi:hypothetical protein